VGRPLTAGSGTDKYKGSKKSNIFFSLMIYSSSPLWYIFLQHILKKIDTFRKQEGEERIFFPGIISCARNRRSYDFQKFLKNGKR
jgi:hypothetical protein